MALWLQWFRCVLELRNACSRRRTFVWMCLALAGFSIRTELLGVTSFVRSCFLQPKKYRRLLHLFHSPALKLEKLTSLWTRCALKLFAPVTCQDHLVLLADGLKVPKEGHKMPAVKALHQESPANQTLWELARASVGPKRAREPVRTLRGAMGAGPGPPG